MPARPLHTASAALAALAVAAAIAGPAQAQRPERTGAEVFGKVCADCHVKGVDNAPKIGDTKAWAPRAAKGLGSLTASALEGIRKMPKHGGNPGVSDIEIERAIIHMVNQSGGKWIEPLGTTSPATVRTAEQIVQKHCASCHRDGTAGAPKIGDRAAWIPRLQKGLDNVVKSAVHGHGAMPARGGVADLSDTELQGAIVHMFNFGVKMAPPAPPAAKAADPYHQVAAGADVFLGVVPARSVPAGAYAGTAPKGKDYYHVNLSLYDTTTKAAVTDAKVVVKVSDPLGAQTKTLEVVSGSHTISYGGFFRMSSGMPVQITAEVQRPGAAGEARFEVRAR